MVEQVGDASQVLDHLAIGTGGAGGCDRFFEYRIIDSMGADEIVFGEPVRDPNDPSPGGVHRRQI